MSSFLFDCLLILSFLFFSASSSPSSSPSSLPSLSSPKSCPFVNEEGVDHPDYLVMDLRYGQVGNHIVCSIVAMDRAYRCKGTLSLPNFGVFSAPKPSFWEFDFRQREGPVFEKKKGCKTTQQHKTCGEFFRQSSFHHFVLGVRPPLPRSYETEMWSCMREYLGFGRVECPPGMKDNLLIHIRNGDVIGNIKSPYPQVQFSALLTPIFARWWKEIIVISPIQKPLQPRSGPVFDLLYALKVFFPAPVIFPQAGHYRDHLKYWFCAEHVVLAFTSLNIGLPANPYLKTVFTPGFPCSPNLTTVGGISPKQYRTESTVFNATSVTFFKPTETNFNLLSLTPTPTYTLCPGSNDDGDGTNSKTPPPLFEWWTKSSPSSSSSSSSSNSSSTTTATKKVHDLVVDFDFENHFFHDTAHQNVSGPFCALFGAVVSERWNRVIVVVDEKRKTITNRTHNNNNDNRDILFKGLEMLTNSIPLRLSFVQNEQMIQKIRMNVVNLATFVVGQSVHHHQSSFLRDDSVRKIYDISGRGCSHFKGVGPQHDQQQHESNNERKGSGGGGGGGGGGGEGVAEESSSKRKVSLYATTTKKPLVNGNYRNTLYSVCETKFQLCS